MDKGNETRRELDASSIRKENRRRRVKLEEPRLWADQEAETVARPVMVGDDMQRAQ